MLKPLFAVNSERLNLTHPATELTIEGEGGGGERDGRDGMVTIGSWVVDIYGGDGVSDDGEGREG